MGYAIKYRHSLKKLALVGCVASHEFLTDAKQNLAIIGTREQQTAAEKLWAGSFSDDPQEIATFYQLMAPLYSYTFNASESSTSISTSFNVNVMNFGFAEFLRRFDYRDDVPKIDCPTLILQGENDWIFDKRQAEMVQTKLKNSELVVYQQCGHLLWIDQWERFLQDMMKFLCHE